MPSENRPVPHIQFPAKPAALSIHELYIPRSGAAVISAWQLSCVYITCESLKLLIDSRLKVSNMEERWPNGAKAAICLTIDNMGEAADLNRNLWPESEPIGKHYSVTKVIPQLLGLLKKYDVSVTYFIESWNTNVYGDFILNSIASAGHEIGWHAWQHEAWAKLDAEHEKANFERSFGPEGIGKWLDKNLIEPYHGFRPPGGPINGDRTLSLCRRYGLDYLSPAADEAATVDVDGGKIIVLPYKWATVDAYYYMETFGGLRKLKGEYPVDPQSPEVMLERFKSEVDQAMKTGGFRAILFHPFLTDRPERLDAVETMIKYLVEKRDQGEIWLARCRDVAEYVKEHPESVGTDPKWDMSSWR